MSVDWSAMKMLCSQEFWRMALLWTLSLLLSHFHLLFASPLAAFFPSVSRSSSTPSCYPRCRFSHEPESKIERPICVITGATSGLGRAAARALAAEGYHVVLVGRSSQLLDQTIQEIKQKHGDAYLTAFQVDMASIHSIMNFGSSLKQWLLDSNLHPSVQLLINNAGILATSCRVTSDGYDHSVDPGAVETSIMRELPRCLSQLAFTVLRCLCLLQSPEDGVNSILDAALAPPEVSGKYFFGGKGRTIRSSTLSYNPKLAKDLWSTSNTLFQESVLMKG